ncbi:MAG: hypothetical protein Ta2D_02540 [Rickettsiales bacterium]|nr:MAG: hypothetical protein Ta2D_02540 [Rickettsiales bacterium]
MSDNAIRNKKEIPAPAPAPAPVLAPQGEFLNVYEQPAPAPVLAPQGEFLNVYEQPAPAPALAPEGEFLNVYEQPAPVLAPPGEFLNVYTLSPQTVLSREEQFLWDKLLQYNTEQSNSDVNAATYHFTILNQLRKESGLVFNKVIANGNFGLVCQMSNEKGKPFAVKIPNNPNNNTFMSEDELKKDIDVSNLLHNKFKDDPESKKLFALGLTEQKLNKWKIKLLPDYLKDKVFIMKKRESDLHRLVNDVNIVVSNENKKEYILQMTKMLNILHSKDKVCPDFKLLNILYNRKRERLELADLSTIMPNGDELGAHTYYPPEILKNVALRKEVLSYEKTSDSFLLGTAILTLFKDNRTMALVNYKLHMKKQEGQVYEKDYNKFVKCIENEKKELFEILKNNGYDEKIAEKISNLLEPNPSNRTSVEDLLPELEDLKSKEQSVIRPPIYLKEDDVQISGFNEKKLKELVDRREKFKKNPKCEVLQKYSDKKATDLEMENFVIQSANEYLSATKNPSTASVNPSDEKYNFLQDIKTYFDTDLKEKKDEEWYKNSMKILDALKEYHQTQTSLSLTETISNEEKNKDLYEKIKDTMVIIEAGDDVRADDGETILNDKRKGILKDAILIDFQIPEKKYINVYGEKNDIGDGNTINSQKAVSVIKQIVNNPESRKFDIEKAQQYIKEKQKDKKGSFFEEKQIQR